MEKIIQISAGRGPVECQWVVARVLKYFLAEARDKGIYCTVLDRVKGQENGTLHSATVQLEGNQLSEFFGLWRGTVQWVGKSQFRKHHKRKNWFVGVYELDLRDVNFSQKQGDFKFEATRGSGPGGQHVNKVSTAVRVTHIPTGLAVLASDSRSQSLNRKNAKDRLINLLKARQLEEKAKKANSQWQNHNTLERGNPTRIFKGSDFKSNFQDKSYKKQRLKGKRELKEWIL